MYNQRRHRDDHICEKNHTVPDIIPLTEDNNAGPPTGTPVSSDKSIVDYLLGHPTTESEGDFVSDDADDGPR